MRNHIQYVVTKNYDLLHNTLPFAFTLLGFHSSSESLSEGITGGGHFDFLFLRMKSGIGAGKPVEMKPKFDFYRPQTKFGAR